MNRVKGKNIPKALLDAGYNCIDNKTKIEPSSLLRGLGLTLTNNEIKGIIKVIKSLEKSGILQIKSEFLDMLLGNLVASAIGIMLAGKAKMPEWEVIRAGEGAIATSQEHGTIRAC